MGGEHRAASGWRPLRNRRAPVPPQLRNRRRGHPGGDPGHGARNRWRWVPLLQPRPVRRYRPCRAALTPRFDEPSGRAAFAPERSAAQDAEWEALGDYSFVQPLPAARGWYAIRAQMRWALENQPSAQERVVGDHRWWREHWKARSAAAVDDAASLAWYHRYS